MIYKYLEKKYVKNWIEGKSIKLSPAKSFLGFERNSRTTIDEGRHVLSYNASGDDIISYASLHKGRFMVGNFYMEFESITGKILKDQDKLFQENDLTLEAVKIVTPQGTKSTAYYNQIISNGLILCFSTVYSKDIAERLLCDACIAIHDSYIKKLVKEISSQIKNKNAQYGICKYTEGGDRNAFLKSLKDEWQKEFRIFWKGDYESEKFVNISPGIAFEIDLNTGERI